MKILFVVPYPQGTAPSQRFRFEHYLQYLDENGIEYRIRSFLSTATWNILYKPGYKWKKVTGVLEGFFNRVLTLFLVRKYDFVFIHREATPLGPAWFEWIITKMLRKKMIYDFDDAIWISAVSKNNSGIAWLRNVNKVKNICRWATIVVTGNSFLASYASQFNKKVKVIPTVVNTEAVHSKFQDQQVASPSIGWTGSFSTLQYLDIVLPVLQELQEKYGFTFIVIADRDPGLSLKNYRFIKWKRDTEVEDLLNFHIGLMPLYDDEISKGKCGFKAIQYMSLGIPAVVSPVGVNSEIVDDSVNGFLCESKNDWKMRLEELLNDAVLRQRFGTAARQKIVQKYSVNATVDMFMDIFK